MQANILKDYFPQERPIHFYISSTIAIRLAKRNKLRSNQLATSYPRPQYLKDQINVQL